MKGEEGHEFFFVEQGELEAEKVFEEGKLPEKVYEYRSGDYFGELALLKNVPRQASIKCKVKCQIIKDNMPIGKVG